MNRRVFITAALGGAATGFFGIRALQDNRRAASTGALVKIDRQARALGTTVTLTVYGSSEAACEAALDAAFGAIEEVESEMSLYRPESALSRLNREGILNDPPDGLFEVLSFAGLLSSRTEGAFDVTVQPLWRLHAESSRAGAGPDPAALREAISLVNWEGVEVSKSRIQLSVPGMALTLNGIAQGYAADRAVSALRGAGIEHAMIDTGEVRPLGEPTHKPHWTAGIRHPRRPGELLGVVALDGRCVATSGDYETHFTEDYRNNHLFNPRTGRSPLEFSSVTVAAPSAMEADAYSTAVAVMGRDDGYNFIKNTSGVDALFVTKSGDLERTDGFPMQAS